MAEVATCSCLRQTEIGSLRVGKQFAVFTKMDVFFIFWHREPSYRLFDDNNVRIVCSILNFQV